MLYQSRDLIVTNFFKSRSAPNDVLEMTEEAKRVLEIDSPNLEPPFDAVPSYLDGEEEEVKIEAAKFAKSLLRCEPVRSAKRGLCKAMSSELRERVSQGNLVVARAEEGVEESQLEEADFDAPRIGGWRLVPLGFFLLFSLALVAWSLLLTEPTNAKTMLDLSGFLEDHTDLAKISFAVTAAVLIFATFLVVPLVFNTRVSKRVDKLTLVLSLPTGLATLFLLGKSMGDGISPDPFNPSSTIPQWLVLCMVGVSSAGVAVLAKIAVRHALKLIYGVRESQQLVFHRGRSNNWTRHVGQATGMISLLDEIIYVLDAEETAFAARFVGEVLRSREYLNEISIRAIERARIDAKPIPVCFRPTHGRMNARPPKPSSNSVSSSYQPSKNGKPTQPK